MSERKCKKAFDIGRIPKNLDLSTPPVTGFDYLYRVRLESRKCPKVVVSDIDKTKFLSRQTVQVDPFNGFVRARPGFEPDLAWQEVQLETFISTRMDILENREELLEKFPKKAVPKIHDENSWCLYCLGSNVHEKVFRSRESTDAKDNAATSDAPESKEHIDDSCASSKESTVDSHSIGGSKESDIDVDGFTVINKPATLEPCLSDTITSTPNSHSKESIADLCTVSNSTKANRKKPDTEGEPRSKRSRYDPDSLDFPPLGHPPLLSIVLHLNQTRITRLLAFHIGWLDDAGFSDAQGRWLYALLMCLEKPLDPDDCAMLRSLARKCSELRGELQDPADTNVMSINLVLAIIARFFDQKDMSDGFLAD